MKLAALWAALIIFLAAVGLLILMLLALNSGILLFKVAGYGLGILLFGLLFILIFKECREAAEKIERGRM